MLTDFENQTICLVLNGHVNIWIPEPQVFKSFQYLNVWYSYPHCFFSNITSTCLLSKCKHKFIYKKLHLSSMRTFWLVLFIYCVLWSFLKVIFSFYLPLKYKRNSKSPIFANTPPLIHFLKCLPLNPGAYQ